MVSKFNELVRQLLRKNYGYVPLGKFHPVCEPRRNYHFIPTKPENFLELENNKEDPIPEDAQLTKKEFDEKFDSNLEKKQKKKKKSLKKSTKSKKNAKSSSAVLNAKNYLEGALTNFVPATPPAFVYVRNLSNRKWGNEDKKGKKCEKENKPKCPARPCPKWIMPNCPSQAPQNKEPCPKKKKKQDNFITIYEKSKVPS